MVSGNPSKAVTGTGLGLEFDNIATMSTTKVDTSSNATLLSLNVTGSTIPTNGIYSPAANQLGFATNSTQRGLISSVGGWTVNAPSSGITLVVNSVDTTQSIQAGIVSATKNPRLFVTHTESTGLTDLSFTGSSAPQGTISIGGTTVISLSNNRNVTISAPSSGDALTVSAVASAHALTVNGASGAYALLLQGAGTAGNNLGLHIQAGLGASDAALAVQNSTATATFFEVFGDGHGFLGPTSTLGLSWNTAGNITIAAPSSGVGLTVSGGGVTVNAPSGNAAIATPTAGYTFGNSTDNPTYAFAGTGAISGVGSGLTSLNATNLSSGTVADGRLSANVPLLNAANTFTLANVFNISARTAHSMAAGSQTFGNSTDNPTYTFAGTGATTFNGTVTGLSFIPTSATVPANGLYLAAANTLGLAANSVNIARMTSTAITGLGPVAAAQVDMTPDKGTFVGTLTGCTTSPTVTCTWSRVGNLVSLWIPNITATSNAATCTITGLPAAIQPAALTSQVCPAITTDNAVVGPGGFINVVNASGTLTLAKSGSSATGTFTASGTKGLSAGALISYTLN